MPSSSRGPGKEPSNIFCLPFDFGWNDLGSWTALHEHHVAKQRPADNNQISGEGIFTLNAVGNYVHAPGKFVAVVGVSDLVVVETERRAPDYNPGAGAGCWQGCEAPG